MQAREWVNLVRVAAVALGMANASLAAAQESSAGENEAGGAPRTEYILAVSWQPGFCETRPDRKECVDQTARRFDATHFSLHGLWPLKKSYCGVEAELKVRDRKGDWLDLPEVAVQDETAKRLLVAMPGVKSGLDRHQWLRNGTCHTANAEDYFALQLRLLDEINSSAVRTLFAEQIGKELDEKQIKQAFDQSFGAGTGERVRMRCQSVNGRSVITGLTIGLSGELSGKAELAELIQAAGPTEFKCGKGIAAAAGRG
ncbi:ribonuclease T2 [Sinorhizobium medicae]|uniref:Putative ribonuclease protein n=1 Tax=Sinorhizobium medicae TaxID=110321 RepID=A0A508X082_9HYPH|nr:ribonuclease [Sinorhizobium medicae]MDX0424282.1 ribonuclease [Sinorhizobium medicae]MDX0522793.1 ribonuclease [Sinorhizobium medicae]MDX0547775.1 ribonuclease [Sinorhizobium medicae]MDX0635149.1 ribonuclease [Sinorhizobium medicae]MDX0715169.1 ribonuclease [Sinorhizobium medicae]